MSLLGGKEQGRKDPYEEALEALQGTPIRKVSLFGKCPYKEGVPIRKEPYEEALEALQGKGRALIW